MADSDAPDQIPLFDDDSTAGPIPHPQPWRSTPADAWRAEAPPSASTMEQASLDLLRRNLEFLRAMELHAGDTAAGEVLRFREQHEELIRHLVRWRIDDDKESGSAALAALGNLAGLRLRALTKLDSVRLRKVMAAEPRVRIRDMEIERALSMAEFGLAEERGELVALEIPTRASSFESSGLLGPDMAEALVQAHMDGMKAEQERRPLPARESLGTLLRDLPVEWLDATWAALGLGSDRPRHRKKRERTIARQLTAEGTLTEVVGERLSTEERRLLALLLERGGTASAAAVARRFGSDRDDGWFWNEEPPTSVLGRVRLHGVAFVGAGGAAGSTRTVLVPRELRQGLEEALASAGTGAEEGARHEESPATGLCPELVEALDVAFPDGVVESVWDAMHLEAIEDDLRRELVGLSGAKLLYERTSHGEESWGQVEPFDSEDPEEGEEYEAVDEEGWDDRGRSYGLFFLSPEGEEFRFQIEGEFMDEAGRVHPTRGAGRIGWAVAVSGPAPIALLRVTSLDFEERFGTSIPDIQPRHLDVAGAPVKEEDVFLDMLGAEERDFLDDLRQRIAEALMHFGIAVLSEEEVAQAVPWLEAAEGVLVGWQEGAPLTVEDAFFFRHLW